jgi:hypothetical protein
MARRRKHDRPRTKSGRLSRAYMTNARDPGTPELQAKREAAVGSREADPALSATAPGRYYARGLIEQHHYLAALTLRALYATQFGPGWPGNAEHGPPASEDYLARCRKRLDGIAATLGERAFLMARDFAVFDRHVRREPLLDALSRIPT